MINTETHKQVLLKPLFVDLMFNRSGQKMRAKFVKTVSCDEASYDLYIKGGETPENSYPQSEDDRFYLRVLHNGWLIPIGLTEQKLRLLAVRQPLATQMYGGNVEREEFYNNIRKTHTDAEAERLILEQLRKEAVLESELGRSGKYQAEYIKRMLDGHIQSYTACKEGSGGYPDFAGAALINDLDHCIHLSDLNKKAFEEERKQAEEAARQKAAEEAAQEATEKAKELAAAEDIFRNGGTISSGKIIVALADKYHVTVPLRTRGWILKTFAKCVFNGDSFEIWKWETKNRSSSTKVYDVIGNIRTAIKKADAQRNANE